MTTDQFDEFLTSVDEIYADYFASNEKNVNSIRNCFSTLNGSYLLYNLQTKLRLDIKELVIKKHKDIYGELHSYKEAS